ncbi:MAG: FecR domain-containing protein [Deltaproteobacteria bacterium]|nr:FecR domain-containing protein [Deltaproteobacteria bacterium]
MRSIELGKVLCDVWLVIFLIGMGGCTGCAGCSDDAVAVLNRFQGDVSRDHTTAKHQWEKANSGDRFYLGEGVRTGPKSDALLRVGAKSMLHMKENTAIRFELPHHGKKKLSVRISQGIIIFDAASDDTQLNTGFGVAIVEKGGSVRVSRDNAGVVIDVVIGMAQFVTEAGDIISVTPSTGSFRVTVEGARFLSEAEFDNGRPSSPKVPASTDTETDDETKQSDEDTADFTSDDNPEKAGEGELPLNVTPVHPNETRVTSLMPDMRIVAGGRVWVHAVTAPVHMELQIPAPCSDGAVLRIQGTPNRFVSTNGRLVGAFRMGASQYDIRCGGDPGGEAGDVAVKGVVVVVKDLERFQLSQSAPATTVLTDGRKYNVAYQSKLPLIRVEWPEAPVGNGYTLHVQSGSDVTQIDLKTPKHRFASGDLAEGMHTFHFVFNDTGFRSRHTQLAIRFDNASDKAVFNEPREGEFLPGEVVHVSGVLMPDWEVQAVGGDIAVDSAGRFQGEVKHNPLYRGIALKFSHPKRGQHYYIRHSATGTAQATPNAGESK